MAAVPELLSLVMRGLSTFKDSVGESNSYKSAVLCSLPLLQAARVVFGET